MSPETLNMSLRYVKGVGPKLHEKFAKKGLITVRDALYFFPRDYQDRRRIDAISEIRDEGSFLIKGKVVRAGEVRYFSGARCFEVYIEDDSGATCLKWLNYNPIKWRAIYTEGKNVLVYGNAKFYQGRIEFLHPEVTFPDAKDTFSPHEYGTITPIYSEVEGVHQKVLRKVILKAVADYSGSITDPLPDYILSRESLPLIGDAIRFIHLPEGDIDIDQMRNFKSRYHRRVIFDEFFSLQLGLARKRYLAKRERGMAIPWDRNIVGEIKRRLPFQLTGAQRRVVNEVLTDMKRQEPMKRLLQGDVGSGKTIVAWIASMVAWHRGYQVAIMAPTEILAEQHFKNFFELSKNLDLTIRLLTASVPTRKKITVKERLIAGEIDIIVGTHALIQEDVAFQNLALAIVDEQHRFGVYQRLKMKRKGESPHLLVMTATPIPRTLAMTLYGDLDISVIDEMPPGRKPVESKIIYERQRGSLYEFLRRETQTGGQVFIVYPLVDESEKLDVKAATEMYGHLKKEVFPDREVALIHGRMKGEEKDKIIENFRRGDVTILVSTTVIEVGIDIPTAHVMVIEHAERFGLSQLHQLRGRVGRSDRQSYCFLVTSGKQSEDARRRLEVIVATTDGFAVAEEDLSIRGPGDYIGTRQAGMPDLIFGNILRDSNVLKRARDLAFEVISRDPNLTEAKNRKLAPFVRSMWGKRIDFAFV